MKTKFTLLFCLVFVTFLSAQDQAGGPYTTDANTVLLLHFNDSYTNDAPTGGTATAHGTVTFVDGMEGLGKCIFLDNHAVVINETTFVQFDTSYVSFADIPELDITGDITVEGWFKYADTTTYSWNSNGYLVSKIDTLSRFNYRVNTNLGYWEDWARFGGNPGAVKPEAKGYGAVSAGYTPDANTGWSVGNPGIGYQFKTKAEFYDTWMHFTYQKASDLDMISLIVQDAQGNILLNWSEPWSGGYQIYPAHRTPVTSDLPLLLGRMDPSGTGYFHGYLDEIRISNVVRYFDFPPKIKYPHYLINNRVSPKLYNVDATLTEYPINVNVAVLGSHSGVQTASLKWRVITDPREKVGPDDAGWNVVSLTQGTGDMFTGAIPQQTLGTVIDYFVEATSSTGKKAWFGFNPDSLVDRIGVWNENDMVLKYSFEEEDMEFVDGSGYNQQLDKNGNWVLWDAPGDVPEGNFCIYLQDGAFAGGEVVSPFPACKEFTMTAFVNSDKALSGNTYILGYYPRDWTWYTDNYTFLGRGGTIGNDSYISTVWPGEMPWMWGTTSLPEPPVGVWTQWMVNLGPDSMVTQENKVNFAGEDTTIKRGVFDPGYVNPYVALAPSIGSFRIGPQTGGGNDPWGWSGAEYFIGKLDEVIVYNYQWDPLVYNPSSIEDQSDLPFQYQLSQNYPNPFNPNTHIRFAIGKKENVSLEVYDMTGRLVKTLISRAMPAGEYTVEWNGTDVAGKTVASGIYIYKLKTPAFQKSIKMVFLK